MLSCSAYFKKVGGANVLHERLDPKARDFIIRKAATHGQATFASTPLRKCEQSAVATVSASSESWEAGWERRIGHSS